MRAVPSYSGPASAFTALVVGVFLSAQPARAQPLSVSRSAAINAAVARGPRLQLAVSDTALASAQVVAAGAFPSPAVSASYSQSTPQYHVALDIPVDYPWHRSLRQDAARAGLGAARYSYQYARAAVAFDADTLYTTAQARAAHVQLSRTNAEAADSLLRIATARRDAGDASELDVELASLFVGEQHNVAAADSLELTETLLALQLAMGLDPDTVRIAVRDSLDAESFDDPSLRDPTMLNASSGGSGGGSVGGSVGETPALRVASATAQLRAAELNARLEQRSRWLAPAFSAGFETRDPGGTGNRLLPTIGLSLPLPLFNGNRGPIAVANAERVRAQTSLRIAQGESQLGIAQSVRARELANARVQRGAQLVASANRVAAMSLIAFREGAAPLATVLEAQRTARDVLRTHIDNIARAWIASATARLLTLSASPNP